MKQAISLHEKSQRAEGREEYRDVLHEMGGLAHRLKLSGDVRKRAATLCSGLRTGTFGHGTPRPVLAAATLYVACREEKVPITLREFADAIGSDPREVGRCYLGLLENMHISRPGLNGRGYVYRIALTRQVSDQVMKLAQDLINRMSEKGLGGRNPMTLAAAALYLACCSMGENVTQAEVAEAAGVGEESVRECCKEIRRLAAPFPE